MTTDSRYKPMNKRLTQLRHTGFDFRGRILVRTLDNNLFKNPVLRGFLVKLESIITEWFMQTRNIKVFRQIAIEKDDEDNLII